MNDDRIKMRSLHYLYKEQKNAKLSLARAEDKPRHRHEEISELQNKLEVLDWLIAVAIKED